MELKIGPTETVLPQVLEKMPPALHRLSCIHGTSPREHEVHLICSQTALQQIDSHSRSNLYSELGGFLLGEAFQKDGYLFVEVSAAIPALSDEHGPVHFTFTADAWANAHKVREEQYPGLKIVGWFHTHPNLGVFYSDDDVIVHSTAFSLPWHVGLVIDPIRDEAALFGWDGRRPETQPQVAPIPGFFELSDIRDQSQINWELIFHEGLQGMRSAALKSRVFEDFLPDIDSRDNAAGYLFLTMLLTLIFSIFYLLNWHERQADIDALTASVAISAETEMAAWEADGRQACEAPGLAIYSPAPDAILESGAVVPVVGTASQDGVYSYQLLSRQVDPGTLPQPDLLNQVGWETVEIFRSTQSQDAAIMAHINTDSFEPGRYLIQIKPIGDQADLDGANTVCLSSIEIIE